MPGLANSIALSEARLREVFDKAVDEKGLLFKRKTMRRSAFLFLRATCWRWAECAPDLCAALMDATRVPSVGDAHAGNFGLWRDGEARLVWGVNDYDEAARLPYALDLVRLCASILLAADDACACDIADQALAGYRAGLTNPRPFVLECEHLWLRDAFMAGDDEREDFWKKLENAPEAEVSPASFRAPLIAALPPMSAVRISSRRAGVGSLGRPRYVASGLCHGGPVAAEIKGLLPSCWEAGRETGLARRMAAARHRSPDSALLYADDHVRRRLAPNNRKLDFETIKRRLRGRLIKAMAKDLAAVHLGEDTTFAAIDSDLRKRPSDWLAEAAVKVADWTKGEFAAYRVS